MEPLELENNAKESVAHNDSIFRPLVSLDPNFPRPTAPSSTNSLENDDEIDSLTEDDISCDENEQSIKDWTIDPLRTAKGANRFEKACKKYASRRDIGGIINHMCSASRLPGRIKPVSPITVVHRLEEIDDASRVVGKLLKKRHVKPAAIEVLPEELAEEEQQANAAIAAEEAEIRKELKAPRKSVATLVVSLESLTSIAQEITQSEDAAITSDAFELLVYYLIKWLRRVMDDVIIIEEQVRELMFHVSESTFFHQETIEAAIAINGYDHRCLDKDQPK